MNDLAGIPGVLPVHSVRLHTEWRFPEPHETEV